MKRIQRIPALLVCFAILLGCLYLFGAADTLKMGDGNLDGRITSADARIALRMATQLDDGYTAEQYLVCDVTGDDVVRSRDARLILQVAIGIYDESYFYDKFTTEPVTVSATTTEPRTTRNWDNIFGTSAVTTSRTPTTTARPTHPNNNHTASTSQTDGQDEQTTLPDGSEPVTEESGTVPGESDSTTRPNDGTGDPSETATGTTIIYTGTPSRPSRPDFSEEITGDDVNTTVPAPTTTEPVTADPTAPAFRITSVKSADGIVRLELYVKNVRSLQAGTLEMAYDSDLLEYTGFTANEALSDLNFRQMNVDQLLGMFTLTDAAPDGELYLGSMTFRVLTSDNLGTSLTLSVKDDSSYNWTSSSGRPMERRPESLSYYLLLNAD